MRWRKLTKWPVEEIWRGSVFRILKTEWPYEETVDYFLITTPHSPSGFSLIVATGYKAGAHVVDLPRSAKAKGKVQAISRSWLAKNWQKKIYAPCPIERVRFIENYPSNVDLP